MQVIQEGNTDILKKLCVFFPSFKKNVQYKIHKYVIMLPTESNKPLLYNTITGELVLLEEGDNVFSEYFLKHVFLVPKNFHEEGLPVLIREIYESQRSKSLFPLGYTIVTTTGCNARCFYCYEKGVAKKPMTVKTARDLADFIVKNYEKQKKQTKLPKPVTLSWFGGEPLFNKKAITTICQILKEKGIPYNSSMISNGYLFNDETVEEAIGLWKLSNVQITLDGTQDVYNKAKNYIYKGTNPFNIVLDNIRRLTEKHITVSIRLNVGFYNREDLSVLVDQIAERFKGNKFISIYTHALFDAYDSDIKDEESDKAVYEALEEIDKKIEGFGISSLKKNIFNFRSTHCMADSGKHMCILSDGRITLCEHYVDSNEIGTIYDYPEKINWEMVGRYKEVKPPFPACFDCPLIMECSTLAMCCDGDERCSPARQRYKMLKKIDAIKNVYDVWEKDGKKKRRKKATFQVAINEGICP